MFEGEPGPISFKVMGLHVARFVQGHSPGSLAGGHQVAGDFGLAVDHHRLTAGQAFEVDMGQLAIERQLKAIMHQAFGVHASADAGLAQQVDHALFQHTGADAALHVVGALAL